MKIGTLTGALVLFALAACQQDERAAAGDAQAPVMAGQPEGRPAAMPEESQSADPMLPPGEYRLAGTDGESVDLPHAITVSVSGDTIAMVSQCVTPRWRYAYTDGGLETEALPEPICERGLFPAEEAAMAVFGSPESVTRTPQNGWLVEGGGHSLTLFSQ